MTRHPHPPVRDRIHCNPRYSGHHHHMSTPLPDLGEYRRVVVVTGAGISAPSGVPTYRQAGSGWTDSRREQMSHASRYGNHLAELWEFWGELRRLTAEAQPNAAHLALAELEERCRAAGGWVTIATQNVDRLHQRAGSSEVHELHGSVHRSRCMRKSCAHTFEDPHVPASGAVPTCPRCGKALRPDVVLFGEQLSRALVGSVQERLREADLCLYVGTSGNVWPVSDLVTVARRSGARCVLVNAEEWDNPHPDFHDTVLGPAEELLPTLLGTAAHGEGA